MRIVAIEEHWVSPGLAAALAAMDPAERDESLAFYAIGDHEKRLTELGAARLEWMDAAGIEVSVLGVAPPGTQALPAATALPLAREANDLATEAVRAHPARLRALATVPTADPAAAAAELERCATRLGHVGVMIHGRTGSRPLDDPCFGDLLAVAAHLGMPIFIHPQIPPAPVRDVSYRGFGPTVDLALATFGWGWHMEAGLAALRLVLRGTFDRHPDLQIILGHWGEMILFWMDRADALSAVATHLDRRVADYIRDNIYITCSGMLGDRLLRHALDFTTIDRIMFSTDYPFVPVDAAAIQQLFAGLPHPPDREKFAYRNAERLFRIR